MTETTLKILKNIFAVGIFVSPLISFLIVRKIRMGKDLKIAVGIILAVVLSIICYVIVMLMAYQVGIFK